MFAFFIETILLGLRNLRLHKLRSTLTSLGIVIGVLSFIMMVAIGEGTKRAAIEQMNQLGARNILLRSVPPAASNDASQRSQRILDYGLRRADLTRMEALRDAGVAVVVPLRDTEQRVVRGDNRANANAIGTTPDIFPVVNLQLARGRCFNNLDYEANGGAGAHVCVLGAMAAAQLFPYSDPIGQPIQVGSSTSRIITLIVVGVLERTGLRPGGTIIKRDIDQDIYFPLTVAQNAFKDITIKFNPGSFDAKRIELSEIWLQAKNIEDVEMLAGIAENALQRTHSGPVDFEVKAPIEILRAAEQQQKMFNLVLGTISTFSLLVGGIGIMNIMLASVTERTREIGIRRALGAKRRHITLQFLIETTVISLSGGIAGVTIGCALATISPYLVRSITGQNYPMAVAIWSVVVGLVFSGVVGIGFGLYPAVMAAQMNPIEALRHE